MRSHSTWTFVVGSLRIMILYCWSVLQGAETGYGVSCWAHSGGEPHDPLHYDKRTACRLPRFAKASSPPSLTHRVVSQLHHRSPTIYPCGRCWQWISSMSLDTGTDGSTQRLSTWLERFGNGGELLLYIRPRPAFQISCSELLIKLQ